MFLRQSTLAVAIVIALSAAAATTQVFAADDAGQTSSARCGASVVSTVKALFSVLEASASPTNAI